MKKILTITAIASILALTTGCTAKREIVEIKPSETAYSVSSFSNTSEKQGGDSSQKFNNTREYWETIKNTSKLITVEFERKSTGAIPFINSIRIPTHKIVVVSQQIFSKDWVSDLNRGSNSKDDGFRAESSNGAEFSVGVTLSARVEDTDTFVSIYGTDPNAKLTDVKIYATSLDTVLERTIRPFIQGELASSFSKLSTSEIQPRKNDVIKEVAEATKKRFAQDGITILTMNASDTLTWSDSKIQTSINETAQLLADKEKKEAQQKVESIEATTRRMVAEEEARRKANEMIIISEANKHRAEQERQEADIRNKMAIDKAKADKEIALERQKVMDVEREFAKIEIEKMKAQAILTEATAKEIEANKFDGVKPYSRVTITGSASVVDTNGKVQLMNLTK